MIFKVGFVLLHGRTLESNLFIGRSRLPRFARLKAGQARNDVN